MKKIFAIIAMMGVFTFGMTQSVMAQDDAAATEQVDSAVVDSTVTDSAVVEEEIVEEIEQEPLYVAPKPVQIQQPRQQQVQKPVRQSQKQQYYVQEDANREKYTSTMDIALRRQIKIACATRGIMFAKFVEDACREKLAREGVR